jgi:hypothetical protein
MAIRSESHGCLRHRDQSVDVSEVTKVLKLDRE